ncbi:hypothetical protein [Paenibacillus sp. FJAT-26967]|uniref:hypothetical protein n=1 Tax=Paenibacillus sp. FJAT-26967 TaxID=1729690 RepID=UPI000838E70D|nr:hypothetical protein [Paenibacillus sp. FJAT-26967]
MQFSFELKPYNDFWMNCILNAAYTIAVTVDPSYKYAALMNDYRYKTWGAAIDSSFITPTLDVLDYEENWNDFILHQVIAKETPHTFKDSADFLSELKEIIADKQIIKLNVDLFYWLPKNIACNKFHMSHYAIINGFDTRAKMYHVLDDDIDGYGTHLIPEERVVEAFMNSGAMTDKEFGGPHAYIYHLQDQIVPYRLSLQDIQNHAARLKRELADFSFDGLWDIKNSDRFDDYIRISLIGINIISSRQAANGMLIQAMNELDLVDESLFQALRLHVNKIQHGWKSIKQIFINKTINGDKTLNLPLIQSKANELLGLEMKMWSLLVEIEQKEMIIMGRES